MNLLIARTTLESTPPKHLFKITAYEVVAMLLVAALLVIAL